MQEKPESHEFEVRSVEDQVETVAKVAQHQDDTHAHNVAIKGDDSDGKLEWTVRSFMAYLSLCCVYTGIDTPIACKAPTNHFDRFSNVAIFCCRGPLLYR